jgi:conjugal transfer pilin signal peptidase TrbI
MTLKTLPLPLETAIAETGDRAQRQRRRRGLRIVGRLLLSAGLMTVSLGLAYPHYRLVIAPTASLPYTLFWVHVGELPQRCDMAALYVPHNRFYPDSVGFVKILRGLPGDVVTEKHRVFAINGTPIGKAKGASQEGLPLALGPVGVIPPGRYFFATPHRDSYDSRYADIGWIAQSAIVGIAHPIF